MAKSKMKQTECNGVIYTHSASVKFRCAPPAPNPWVVIHERFAKIIESNQEWDGTAQKLWHDSEWMDSLPGCGSCLENYLKIKDLIDWTTAQTASDSFFQIHNQVSEEHAGKPPISYEQFRALYFQQPSLDDCCIAVTSLSPDPDRKERQEVCLNSWKRFGLSIVAVQSIQDELIDSSSFPQISDVVRIADSIPTISQMIAVAKHGRPILLLNSDIEIHGQQSILRSAVEAGSAFGIRHNFNKNWWISSRERWGVDAFVIHPGKVEQIEPQPFLIGKPWWDYWLLDQLRSDSHTWMAEPLFFHRNHQPGWSEADWDHYAEVFAKVHGRKFTRENLAEFRGQFPYFDSSDNPA